MLAFAGVEVHLPCWFLIPCGQTMRGPNVVVRSYLLRCKSQCHLPSVMLHGSEGAKVVDIKNRAGLCSTPEMSSSFEVTHLSTITSWMSPFKKNCTQLVTWSCVVQFLDLVWCTLSEIGVMVSAIWLNRQVLRLPGLLDPDAHPPFYKHYGSREAILCYW